MSAIIIFAKTFYCKIHKIIVSENFVTYGISMKLTVNSMKMITCCTSECPVHMQHHTSGGTFRSPLSLIMEYFHLPLGTFTSNCDTGSH